MRSLLSLFLVGIFVLSFQGSAVESHIGKRAGLGSMDEWLVLPIRAPSSWTETDEVEFVEATTREVQRFLRGIVPSNDENNKNNSGDRALAQQQDWARDDDGNILWWIWLIIGLCCALCCFVCCCSSACCLRD